MSDAKEMAAGIERLFKQSEAEEKLMEKTDEEIADLAIEHVWAGMDAISLESSVVSEMIDRLKRAKGGSYVRGLSQSETGVACDDHWHCDSKLAAHVCTVNRAKPCPSCGEKPPAAAL